MSTAEGEVTGHRNGNVTTDASPVALVRQFLNLLAADDLDAAVSLLATDVDYINVSMPTIHGRERVRKVLGAAMGISSAGFEVYFHSISAEDGVVLTERTDVLTLGPFRAQFWVCGRFDVRGGEIVVWKDYFDWVNVTLAMVRGLVGAVIPALRAKPPLAA
jgi:limonene-1,2-epoxide hydrolase